LIAFLLLIVTALTAGCGQPQGDIGFSGEINITEEEFEMTGEIVDGTGPENTYENVTVFLYSADGTLIEQKEIGTFSRSSEPFSIRSQEVPEYIIIDSPTFWELNSIGVSTMNAPRLKMDTLLKQSEAETNCRLI